MADPQLTDLVTSITGDENTLNATPQFIDASVTFSDADGDLDGAVMTVNGLVSGDRVSLGATSLISLVGGQVFYDADGEGGAAAVVIGTAAGGIDGTFAITFNGDATAAGVEAAIEALTYATVSDTPTATRSLLIDVTDAEGHHLYTPIDFATPVTVMTDFGDRASPFLYLGNQPWFAIGNADGTMANWRYQGGAWQGLITQAPFVGDFGSNVTGTRGEIIHQFGNQIGGVEYIFGLSDGTLVLRGQDNGSWVNGSGYGITTIDVGADATPVLADLDGDGDLDLVVGNQAGEIHYFRNEGTTQVPNFVEQTGPANPFDGITIASGNARPALADMDRDGDLDLVVGAADGRVWYYSNEGSEISPVFVQITNGDFNSGFDVGTFASPLALDVDGDGDTDLLIGRGDGTVVYYENTTPRGVTVTVNVNAQDDPIVHSGTPTDVTAYEDTISPLDLSSISLSEGDGETVVVTLTVDIGVLTATSRDGVTVGGSGGATITLTGTAAAIDAFLNSTTNAVGYAAPAGEQGDDYASLTITADDGHGAVSLGTVNIDVANVNDAPVLTVTGGLTVAENTANGEATLLGLDASVVDPEGNFDGGVLTVGGLLTGDIVSVRDQGDGAGQVGFDSATGEVSYGGVVIGVATGGAGANFVITFDADADVASIEAVIENLTYATTSDAPTASRNLSIRLQDGDGAPDPGFVFVAGVASPIQTPGHYSARPTLADIDGDGDLDAVIGGGNGELRYLENTGSGFAERTGGDNPFSTRSPGSYSSIVFADLDADGDLDAWTISQGNGAARYLRNDGTATAPVFVEATGPENPFAAIDPASLRGTPVLADLDGDGDFDLISASNETGGIVYFENTGSAEAPVFTARGGASFAAFDFSNVETIALGDIDSDGDLDLIIARGNELSFFENTGTAGAPVWTSAGVLPGVGNFGASPTLGDLNGDGRVDLLVGDFYPSFSYFWNSTVPPQVITVVVTAENDAPRAANLPATVTATEDEVSGLDLSAVSISDPDGDGPVTITLTVDAGLLSATGGGGVTVDGSGTDTLVLTGLASAIDAFLNAVGAVSYEPEQDVNGTGVATITITGDDGEDQAVLGTVSVDVTSVNDAPVLTVTSAVTVGENAANAGPVLLGLDATLVDPDNNFDGGSVLVSGLLPQDTVSIRDQGDDAGEVGFDSATGEVRYGGVVIGTATGGVGSALSIVFNAAATTAAVEAVIENLTYANSSDRPVETHHLGIQVLDADGTGGSVTHDTETTPNFGGFQTGAYATPAVADLDGDGDLDIVVGAYGSLRYLENTGVGFEERTGADNPFNGFTWGNITVSPMLADLDADGDLDAMVVDSGNVRYLRNDGTASSPMFVAATGAENPFPVPYILNARMTAVDLDGDGDLDMVVGSYDQEYLRYFENTGDSQAPVYEERTGSQNLAHRFAERWVTPTYGDLDQDGDLDLVITTHFEIKSYLNTGTASSPVWSASDIFTTPYGSFAIRSPVLADLDQDGDLDLLIGEANGTLTYIENTGYRGQPLVVTVTAENDAIEATGVPATVTATEEQASPLDLSGIALSDPDGDGQATITLSVDAGVLEAASGSGVTVAGSGTGTITLTGLLSDIEAFLTDIGAISYTGAEDAEGTGVATLTITGDDGDDQAVLGTVSIDITNVNDAPVLTVTSEVTVGENAANAGPVLLGLDATVVDVEGNFDGGELMVGGLLPEDVVSIRDQGDGAGQVGFDAATGEVSYGGVVIGIATGGEGSDFSIIFDADATATAVQAVIENLTYANAGDTPPTTRSLIVELVDGERDTSGPQTVTVNVTPENDGIEATPLPSAITAVEDQASDLDLSSVSFTDPDGDGQVTFTLSVGTGVLTATSTSFVTVTDSGSGTITLTGLLSEVDAFLKTPSAVRYTGPQNANGTGAATLTITGDDGGGAVTLGTVAIDITAVNDAPVLTLTTNSVTFAENAVNSGYQVLDLGLSVTDVEGEWATGKVSLTMAGGDDALWVVDGDGITVSGNIVSYNGTVIGQIFATAGNGKDIYFSAGVTTAAVNALLGQIGFMNTSDTPAAQRMVAVTVYDDVATSWSNIRMVEINITPENDQPTLIDLPASVQVAEDVATGLDLSGLTLGDGEDDVVTVTLTVENGTLSATSGGNVTVSGSGTGVLVLTGAASAVDAHLNANGAVSYQGAENANGSGADNIEVTVDDGSGPISGGTISVDITAVNDPAELTVTGAPVIAESAANAGPVLLGLDASVVDPEGNFAGGQLIIGGVLAEDVLSIRDQGDGAGQVGFDAATGEVSYGGVVIGIATGGDGEDFRIVFDSDATPAAVEAVIENLTYANDSDTPTATRDLSIRLLDGATNSFQLTHTSPGDLLDGLPFYNRSSFAFADIDDDGDLDAFVSDVGGLAYYENTGSGFVGAASPLSSMPGDFDPVVTFGDLDGDGDLDAIVGTQTGVHYMRNEGTASAPVFVRDTALSAQLNPFPSAFMKPTLLDRDGDGDLDLIMAYGPDGTRYWENRGDASNPNFVQVGTLGSAPPSGNPGVAAGDFDGDGDIDLVRFDWSGNGLTLFENVDGTWVAKGALPGAPDSWYATTTTADIDGDGDLDLIVASYDQGVFYYENTSDRGQTVTVTVTAENDPIEATGLPSSLSTLEDQPWSIDLSGITLSDPDGAPGAVVTITLSVDGGLLTGTSTASVTVGGSGSGTLTLTGTLADIEAFLDGGPISYQGPLNVNGNGAATLTISANDGSGSVPLGQIPIDISALPDPPSVDISAAGATFTFDENTVNAVGQLILPTATLSDPEQDLGNGSRITLYGLLPEDVIGVRGGGAVSYNASTGEISYNGVVVATTFADPTPADHTVAFNANASMSIVQAVLQSLTYSNTSDTPTGQRTLTLRVFDSGGLPSSPIGLIINVTPQDDPTAGPDVVVGSPVNDLIDGGAGDDELDGGDGDDYLRGGSGDDHMIGGSGNDTYVVTDDGDLADETGGDGHDLVLTLKSYTLGGGLEDLTLTSAGGAIDGTGNGLDNAITGNAFANILRGLAGDDTLRGEGGLDTLYGGDGEDILDGGSHNDVLYGEANDDFLYGGLGNDVLDGGTGVDRMEGGAGNDTYIVDNAGDVVVEAAGAGTDVVESSVTFTLGDSVENLILTGSGIIGGTGNALRNTITGNDNNNVIRGGGEIDTLYGMGGHDLLYGDDGADVLDGGNGDDTLVGGSGIDTLRGGGGDDNLYGAGGADKLYGGAGADRFYFTGDDAASTAVERDQIFDLNFAEGDIVDLSGLRADGVTAMSFVSRFTGAAGQMVVSYASASNLTLVQIDVNGDKVADFSLAITGNHTGATGNLYTGGGDTDGGWIL